jgi:hypothetical protein
MRLWTLHPKYLDPQGLVALWREALLARAVLCGDTKGYRHHPQLHRFQAHAAPRTAINAYLAAVLEEATARGYSFNRTKVGPVRGSVRVVGTTGQLRYEWRHLMGKLKVRSPAHHRKWRGMDAPEAHPLFRIRPGEVESWERTRVAALRAAERGR